MAKRGKCRWCGMTGTWIDCTMCGGEGFVVRTQLRSDDSELGAQLCGFGLTKNLQPLHPLYLPADARPRPPRRLGGGVVKQRTCIGFGEKDGACSNTAGTPWTPLWCMECDEKRRAHITRQLERLAQRPDPKEQG